MDRRQNQPCHWEPACVGYSPISFHGGKDPSTFCFSSVRLVFAYGKDSFVLGEVKVEEGIPSTTDGLGQPDALHPAIQGKAS